MGKQSKARQDQALRRELQSKRRFYDFLIQDADFRNVVIGSIVIDNRSIVDYVVRNKEMNLFEEMKKAPITPPFEKVFIEFKSDVGMKGMLIERPEDSLIVTYIAYSSKHRVTRIWGVWQIDLDEHGYYVNDVMHHLELLNERGMETTKGSIIDIMTIALFTIGLMNCRNVQLIENEPDSRLSQAHQVRYRFPLTKFKTIGIKPVGKHYENVADPKEYQDIMPLHLRRGHFATYTDDKPLFGKWVGTVWRPAALVGTEKNGVVVKDYKVLPPEGKAS